jgi:ribosomal protein L37AE/L43A
MLDTQNQGPQCTACGSPMKLTVIVPSMWACRRRGRLATEGAIDSVIDPAPASGVPNAFLSATGRTRVRRDDSALS